MSLIRVILAIVFPPLAVIDKGCGSLVIVTILSVLGWLPGVLAALIIVSTDNTKYVAVDKKPTFADRVDNFNAWAKDFNARQKAKAKARRS